MQGYQRTPTHGGGGTHRGAASSGAGSSGRLGGSPSSATPGVTLDAHIASTAASLRRTGYVTSEALVKAANEFVAARAAHSREDVKNHKSIVM